MDAWAYLDEFRAEADEHLRALDAQLLRLERDPADPAPIRQMFLSAHTIKGAAAMLGLDDVRGLAHAMEDELARLRDGGEPLDSSAADLLFQGVDVLRDLVARATPDVSCDDPRIAALERALRVRTAAHDAAADGGPGAAPYGDAASAPEQAPRDAASGARPRPAQPRALLVDDSATVRLLESMLLAEAGYALDAVGDGDEALARALREPYDLLVTSVETRGLRGLDLAAALRDTPGWQALPIIIMCSDENPVHREQAAAVGVQAYIRKGVLGERRLLEAAREWAPR